MCPAISPRSPSARQHHSYSHDASGNLTSVVGPNTDLVQIFDANSKLLTFTDQNLNKTIAYTNNELGSRASVTTPENNVISYTYDAAAGLDEIKLDGAPIADYDYDAAGHFDKLRTGRRQTLTRGNGVYTEFSYDTDSKIASIVHRKPDTTVLSSFSYEYDAAGNITQVTLANGDDVRYTYDDVDRLTQEARTGTMNYTIDFSYDPVGHFDELRAGRLSQDRAGDIPNPGSIAYAYNAADQLTSETSPAVSYTYTYDLNGNTISKTDGADTWSYTWDYQGGRGAILNL